MTTLVVESGSTPSVLGEAIGARTSTFSTRTSSHAYGWMAQNGGLRMYRSVTRKFWQNMGSMRRPRSYSRTSFQWRRYLHRPTHHRHPPTDRKIPE